MRIETLKHAIDYINQLTPNDAKSENQSELYKKLTQCEKIFQLNNNIHYLCKTRVHITSYFVRTNELQKALEIGLETKKMAFENQLEEEELKCYSVLFGVYATKGDLVTFEELLSEYREKLKVKNDIEKLGVSYMISGAQYYNLKKYDKAFEDNKVTIHYLEQTGKTDLLIYAYNNCGYHLINYDLKLANLYLIKALKLINKEKKLPDKQHKLKYIEGVVYNNLGEMYLKKSELKKSETHLDFAVKTFKELNSFNELYLSKIILSELYLTTHKYNTAKKLLNEVIDFSEENKVYPNLLTAYKLTYQLYEKTNNYKQAFNFVLKYNEVNEYLYNKETTNTINNLQVANELDKFKRERDAAQKIASIKHDFLANMSHEIRAPINSILGICYLLQQDNLSQKQFDYINRLNHSGVNLLAIINDILDITKIEANKFDLVVSEFNLNDVILDIYNQLYPKAHDKNIELNIVLNESNNIMIKGDKTRLSQVLINIIYNAIKFTDHGNVTIKYNVKKSSFDNFVSVEFIIEDTGIGIPASKIKTIFNKYEQANGKIKILYGGSGLGLSIAKKISELMNGTIKVKSKINEGSVFTIKIPFEKTDQQQIIKKVIQQDNKMLNNCLIYIADDNHENLLVISDLLLVFNKSIKIKTALNGLELIELVNKKNPDIIILDLDMPKLNGIETLRILRKKYDPNLKIIGNTAGLVSVQKNELIEMGFDDFIYKPFTGSMLLDVIINTKRAY